MRKAKLSYVILGMVAYCGMSSMAVAATDLPEGTKEKLSSDQFEVRDAAYSELQKWSKQNTETSPETLHKLWGQSKDPEVKTRFHALMKQAVIQRQFGRGKGFVGIMMDPMVMGGAPQAQPKAQGNGKRGISIVQVLPNTAGQKAGLMPGDVILGVDALDFNNLPEPKQRIDVRSLFQDYVKLKHPDDVITLHLLRAGKKMDQDVTLMKRPASADRGMFGTSAAERDRVEADAFFRQWLREAEE